MSFLKRTAAQPLLFCALLLGLGATLGAQDGLTPAEQRRAKQVRRLEEEKEEAIRKRLAANVATLRQLQGAWQLMDYIAPDLPEAGRQTAGFLLVGDEFLSLEVHMAYFDGEGIEESSFIQTGTYRLNFNTYSDLIATCLIGSIDDGGGLTVPQEPGVVSVYSVQAHRGVLLFRGEDGSRLTFERVARGKLTDLLYEETDWLPGSKGREALRQVREASAAPQEQ